MIWIDTRRALMPVVGLAIAIGACSGGSGTPTAAPPVAASPTAAAVLTPTATPAPTILPSALPTLTGRITFIRVDASTGNWATFVVNADGSGERRLLPGRGECPTWSPDGKSILLVIDDPNPDRITMAIVSADGSNVRVLENTDATLNLGCGQWSPDGSHVALEGWDDRHPARNGIYTVRTADGGGLVRVTSSPGGGHDIPRLYSPDGTQIVFTRETDTLYIVPAVGGPTSPLTGHDGSGWPPDARNILSDGPRGYFRLVPVDGGSIRTIRIQWSDGGLLDSFGYSWSPSGERIVFSAGTTHNDVYTMLADGSDVRQLTDDPADEEASSWIE